MIRVTVSEYRSSKGREETSFDFEDADLIRVDGEGAQTLLVCQRLPRADLAEGGHSRSEVIAAFNTWDRAVKDPKDEPPTEREQLEAAFEQHAKDVEADYTVSHMPPGEGVLITPEGEVVPAKAWRTPAEIQEAVDLAFENPDKAVIVAPKPRHTKWRASSSAS